MVIDIKDDTPPHLPCLSFLKSLHPSILMLQLQKPSSHVFVVSIRSEPCRCVCVSIFSCLLSMLCVFAETFMLACRWSWFHSGWSGCNSFVLLFRCFSAYLWSLYRLWASLVGTGITLIGVGWVEVFSPSNLFKALHTTSARKCLSPSLTESISHHYIRFLTVSPMV